MGLAAVEEKHWGLVAYALGRTKSSEHTTRTTTAWAKHTAATVKLFYNSCSFSLFVDILSMALSPSHVLLEKYILKYIQGSGAYSCMQREPVMQRLASVCNSWSESRGRCISKVISRHLTRPPSSGRAVTSTDTSAFNVCPDAARVESGAESPLVEKDINAVREDFI